MGQFWIPMVKLSLTHWRQSLLSQVSLEFQNLSRQVSGRAVEWCLPDFSKAFGALSHDILTDSKWRLDKEMVRWMEKWLNSRAQGGLCSGTGTWMKPQRVVEPFRQTSTGWSVRQRRSFWNSTQANAGSCTCGGAQIRPAGRQEKNLGTLVYN